MNFVPWYLAVAFWLFLGPAIPFIIGPTLVVGLVIIALLVRHQLRQRNFVMLGLIIVMAAQSFLLVIGRILMDLFGKLHLAPTRFPYHSVFGTLLEATFVLSILGAIGAVGMGLYISFMSNRMELSRVLSDARLLEPTGKLEEIVGRLCALADVKEPGIVLVDSGFPETFTVRAHGIYWIAVSVGLTESFDDDELEACLAHEIAHLKNKDFAVRLIATLGKIVAITRPLTYLIEPAIYRTGEYLADATAVKLTKNPRPLISVLAKLEEMHATLERAPTPLLVCSFYGGQGYFDKHPSFDSRIKRIQRMMNSVA